jgi:hypothetical protein
MGDKLQPVNGPKHDAFSMLTKYIQDPGALELTADAERLLKRLMFADTLMKTRKHTEGEVMTQLMETFSISEFTAIKDIKQAQKLFAQARSINKQYYAHLHLERINQDIEQARDALFFYEDDDMPGVKRARVPDAKELAALAKLHHAYSFTLNTAPEEKGQDTLPPPVFNFSMVVINTGMNVQDAMAAADKLLNGSATPELDDHYQDDTEWEEIDRDDITD